MNDAGKRKCPLQKVTQYISLSKPLMRIPHLSECIGGAVVYRNKYQAMLVPKSDAEAVLAWGKKPSAKAAEHYARRIGRPVVRLEDAFLRSVDLGAYSPPLGIVRDNLGIYYDASRASAIEQLIKRPLTQEEQVRAQRIIELWQHHRVSKYNHCRPSQVDYGRAYVLIVDQTYGDASITYGGASADAFERMLEEAQAKYPEHQWVIKTHPDVVAGLKKGHFDPRQLAEHPQVTLESRDVHPSDLLENASAVFCVTSQMGFEALLWGKPVYTFGVPFFAGWGVTQDYVETPKRRTAVSLYQLVHAALVDYACYWHPERQEICSVEALMDYLGQQRRWRSEFPEHIVSQRFPRWKRQHLTRFFRGSKLRFLQKGASLPEDEPVIVWGRPEAANHIAVEDGFIRSVGLGADLTTPRSWVIDDIGMYYDATQPSRLERLLQEADYTEAQLAKAETVIRRLVNENVSKYNVGFDQWQRPSEQPRVILVPGQVESDASVKFGSPKIKSNIELLKTVREHCPDAYVVYKPHPDVVARLRVNDQHAEQIQEFCNEVVINDNMAILLGKVDEVHTMTSLTGFEALLRGLSVTCYGQPFYSGWGLTKDVWPNPRRNARRTLNELVVATLFEYPRYLSSNSGELTSVEQTLDEIAVERQRLDDNKWRLWAQSIKRMILRIKRF